MTTDEKIKYYDIEGACIYGFDFIINFRYASFITSYDYYKMIKREFNCDLTRMSADKVRRYNSKRKLLKRIMLQEKHKLKEDENLLERQKRIINVILGIKKELTLTQVVRCLLLHKTRVKKFMENEWKKALEKQTKSFKNARIIKVKEKL